MTYKIEPSAQEMRAAAIVAETAQLTGVRVAGIIAENRIGMAAELKSLYSEVGFGLREYTPSENGFLLVQVDIKLLVGSRGLDEFPEKEAADCPEGCARIEVSMVGEYRIPEGPMPENIKNECISAFAANNGLHNCWPYFRQQLQYITSSMGLPPFVLGPLLIRAKKQPESPKN